MQVIAVDSHPPGVKSGNLWHKGIPAMTEVTFKPTIMAQKGINLQKAFSVDSSRDKGSRQWWCCMHPKVLCPQMQIKNSWDASLISAYCKQDKISAASSDKLSRGPAEGFAVHDLSISGICTFNQSRSSPGFAG